MVTAKHDGGGGSRSMGPRQCSQGAGGSSCGWAPMVRCSLAQQFVGDEDLVFVGCLRSSDPCFSLARLQGSVKVLRGRELGESLELGEILI